MKYTRPLALFCILLSVGQLTRVSQAVPAESRAFMSGISSLFKSKLGDLYKLRESLQGASEKASTKQNAKTTTTPTTTTPTTTTTTTSTTTTTTTTTTPSPPPPSTEWLSENSHDNAGGEMQRLTDLFSADAVPKDIYSANNYPDINKNLPKPNAYQFNEEDMWIRQNPSATDPPLKNEWDQDSAAVRGDYFGNTISNITSHGPDGDDVPQEYWTRIKGIVGNMKSILEQMYPPESEDEKRTFAVFDKAISFGDNLNVLNNIRKTFDGELLGFLGQKWTDIKENVVNGSPLLKMLLSTDTRAMTKTFMMAVIKHLGHLLHQQAFTHLSELDFVTELMRSSGFKDFEIQQVFHLLDLPTDSIDGNAILEEGRQFGNLGGYSGYNLEKSGGYGHSGGYGGQGAYLIYRLLSSTAGRKREMPDISLALDLSDLPDVVGNLYSWLEKTEEKYGGDNDNLIEEVVEESDSFGTVANQLWSSFQADRLSHTCVKRFLCDYATQSSKKMMGHGNVLEQLALTSLAQLFGEEESAKMMDQVQSEYLLGGTASCSAKAAQCDDVTYETVVTTTYRPSTGAQNKTGSSVSDSATDLPATVLKERKKAYSDPK
ncbi:hypothetical protein SK128_019925 [Halocaridina rubra]|uniref:Uncharacterized protein n=1 Tax=Halocaridina rubra TaxID=373956 RepID=A0AAN8X8V5_HALRR